MIGGWFIMTKENKANGYYVPNFVTFPIAEDSQILDEDSKVSAPSEESTKQVKDWVDFKEM